MKNWIVSFYSYVIANHELVFVGGVVVVSVVIFLMGIAKKLLFNRIKNKLIRKITLSFLSLILVFPATVLNAIYSGFDLSYFWGMYIINSIGTILVYWFYENTGLRNLLSLIGKNTICKLLTSKKSLSETVKDIQKDALSSVKKYEENDLENL